MTDITKKLLTEYLGIKERQFDLAMQNWAYCRDNAQKYKGQRWEKDTAKWEERVRKHRAKVLDIRKEIENA